MQLLFNHNSQQGILDLLDGVVDVAIARADILSDMHHSGVAFLSTSSSVHVSACMHASCASVNMHQQGSCVTSCQTAD